MRDRFSEMIKKGVADFKEKSVGSPVPTLDPMVRAYNNLWGALTDTHMSAVEDGYVITGTYVKSQYWPGFTYCSYYGSTNIKLGSGFCSLENMVNSYGYMMTPEIYNGDYVIKLVKRPKSATAPEGGECVGCDVPCCTNCAPIVYSLGESQIPHPFKEYFSEAQQSAIEKDWKAGQGDATKVVENLNNDEVVNKYNFRISADNKYVIVDECLKINLN